jgi:hypothetical protein
MRGVQRSDTDDNVLRFPDRRVAGRGADTLPVLMVLQDQLALARSGKLRSIALATVSSDGEAAVTRCSCAGADLADLAEMLRALAEEMLQGGADGPSARRA